MISLEAQKEFKSCEAGIGKNLKNMQNKSFKEWSKDLSEEFKVQNKDFEETQTGTDVMEENFTKRGELGKVDKEMTEVGKDKDRCKDLSKEVKYCKDANGSFDV